MQSNQLVSPQLQRCKSWTTSVELKFVIVNVLGVITFDGTHTMISVVFSLAGIDRGCKVISAFGRHIGVSEWNIWPRSRAGKDPMPSKTVNLKIIIGL